MSTLFIIIAVICRIFTNSFSNVFQKQLTNFGENSLKINFINYLILSIFSIPIFFFCNLPLYNKEFWLYAIFGGIFGALCNCFMVMALKRGQLSVLAPINSYKSVVSLIFGIIILGEYPDFKGITGMLLIFFGTFFIFENIKDIFAQDIRYRFYALFFSAIEAVFIKKVIIISSVPVSFAVSAIFGTIFSFIILNSTKTFDFKIPNKILINKYLFLALNFGLMTFTTAFVFKNMNVSYALALFQLSILLNLFFGWKIFSEKNLLKKLAGSLIILIGSTMIILTHHI